MFKIGILKTAMRPLGFLIITLLMTLIFTVLYERHGNQEYSAGYEAAKAEYEKKESTVLANAKTRAVEAELNAMAFDKEINQTLNEALKHEDEKPLDHSCITDDWLLRYNQLVRERR